MQINIDTQSVRAMADRIVKAHPDLAKPKALEILSSGFGYKNFDTLSGVLKKERNATAPSGAIAEDSALDIPQFTPFTLVIDAFACDEYGDCPPYAETTVTPEFLQSLAHHVGVCGAAGVRAAHIGDYDCVWHDPQDDLRMRGTDLVIMPSFGAFGGASFFFQGHKKHANYNCETRAIDLKNLIACIGEAGELPVGFKRERGVLFYDGGFGTIEDLVEQYLESDEDGMRKGDEVWWFDPDGNISSGVYTVLENHGDTVNLTNKAGSYAEVMPDEIVAIDRDDVAEWVGLHYKVNFDAEPEDRKTDWTGRWAQAQRDAS